MPTIEIDFEVFKQLTLRRETESVTYNDVIRRCLGLLDDGPRENASQSPKTSKSWLYKGVRFPSGTELRAHYKGVLYSAAIDEQGILVNGDRASSPSDAARLITNNNVNGWNFWEVRLPDDSRWRVLKSLRSED